MKPGFLLLSGALGSALGMPLAAAEVHGRVVGEGRPLSGIAVAVLPYETPLEEARREARGQEPPAPLASATTRADGTFALSLPPPKSPAEAALRLRVSGPGVPPVLLADVLDAGEDRDVGDLQPDRGAPVSGKVLGTGGVPLAGAEITLWPGTGAAFPLDSPWERLPLRATTGKDGSFKLENAGEFGNRLRAAARGYGLVELVDVRKGALRLPILLPPPRSLDGVVVRADGRTPAAGAVVRFQGRGSSAWVESGANGSFHLEGLPAGEGTITADGGDLGVASGPVPERGKALLALRPGSTIAGRVVDARTARPIPHLRIVARVAGALWFARADSDGRYALSGLPAGSYRLSADDPSYVPWTTDSLRVGVGAMVARDVALTACATLVGRVVDESGAPIADARGLMAPLAAKSFQELFRQMYPGGANGFRTGPDGSFRATRLRPGDGQTLTVSHDAYESRKLGLSLQPGSGNARLTVVLRRGLMLSGVVKDPDGAVLSGVELTLTRTQGLQSRRGQMSFVFDGMGEQIPPQTTSADGRFTFKGLAASQYALTAKKPGRGQKRVEPIVVAEGPPPEPLEVVLSTGAAISGLVRDTAGRGVEGLIVLARPSTEGRGMHTFVQQGTEADGSFVLEDLAAGDRYELQLVTPTGNGPRKAGVPAPSEGVEFTIGVPGGIAGSVTDAEGGRPIPEYTVAYQFVKMADSNFGFRGRDGAPAGAGVPVPFHATDGRFRMAEVPAGTWRLEVHAEGYLDGYLSPVVVEENRATEGIEIRLTRGITLRGRALDADSASPVVDAEVKARLQGDPRGGYSFPFDEGGLRAKSGADGRFEIKGLAPGTYAVSGSHPDHVEANEVVAVKDQDASLDLKLGRGTVIAGGVVAGGRPVAGATVDLVVAGEESAFGPLSGHSAMTGDGGRFRFEHLAPGRYALSATLRSESSRNLEVVLQGGQAREDLVLTLAPGAVIHGRVLGLAEEALNGLSVLATAGDGFQVQTRTTAGGLFEVPDAPQGPVMLRVTSGDFMRATRSVSTQVVIEEGQAEASAELRFEDGFRLSGHVTRGGQPLGGMRVSAFAEDWSRPGATTRSDEDGAYDLVGLGEGRYRVHGNSTIGGGVNVEGKVTLTGDTTLDLDAPLARLAGLVVDAETHKPLADASVWLPAEPGHGGVTDGTGRFALDDLEPRAYHLSARKPGYQTGSSDPTASEDSDVVLELKRGEGFGVIARDGVYGTPLRNLSVQLLDGQGATVFSDELTLDGAGRGEIPSLAPGTYELRASASDYAAVTLPRVSVPTATIALALTPGGHIEIHCGPATLERTDASVRLLTSGGLLYRPRIYSNDGAIPLGEPVRRIEHVVPGHYTLVVSGGPSPVVDVREGETASVNLP